MISSHAFKSFLFSLIIFGTFVSGNAQSEEKIAYFDKKWNVVTDPGAATYYRTAEPSNTGYIVRDYFVSGQIQMYAECSEYVPKLVHNGKVVYYRESGVVAEEGMYKEGEQTGENIFYYDNGKVRKRLDYGDATTAMRHVQYYSPAGDELLENGTGDVVDWDGVGEPSYVSIRNHEIITSFQIHDGQDTVYTCTEISAEYPGGLLAMAKYLEQNITYPIGARRKGIQGTVFVSFIVDKSGKPYDFEVVKGFNPDCDAEAVRVMHGFERFVKRLGLLSANEMDDVKLGLIKVLDLL